MKLSYKAKTYMAAIAAAISITYFGISIGGGQISQHSVDIIEKSPLYPYDNYDYMTTEESYFVIDGVVMEVPAYFRTDFASIPSSLWFIDAPYKSSFVYPAIWHDFMYSCNTTMPRKQIDDVFFWLLRYEQNSLYTSLKMYLAVRVFGGSYFNNPGSCAEMVVQKEQNKSKYKKGNPDG